MHGGMLVAESWFVSSWLRNPLSRRDDNREGRRREGRKEGRRKAWGVEEGLLKRPDPNPVALLAFTWPRRKLCGTRHDDGAKNRWWPTEREKAGPVPAAASHLDSVAGVFGHLRLAACHDSLRLVYSIVTLLSSFLSFLLSSFFLLRFLRFLFLLHFYSASCLFPSPRYATQEWKKRGKTRRKGILEF